MLVAVTEFREDRLRRSAVGIEEQPAALARHIEHILNIEAERGLLVGAVFEEGETEDPAVREPVQLVDPVDLELFSRNGDPVGDLGQIAPQLH
jgi:hypothetical protein